MNYYPFHIGDFRSGTVNMTRQTRWIYRDMLDIYYDDEKPLPLDLDLLCNQIGAESEDERRIVERLLRFKFVKTDDGYWHEICDRVITDYHKKAEIAQANGKKGAATRYQNGEYMPGQGALYAVRVSPILVKVGISANLKSRLHQLRGKYGSQAYLAHHVLVSKMGDAEAELLAAYEDLRDGEEIPIDEKSEPLLVACMNRIAVAYRIASSSHAASPTRSHTNQEPITNNQNQKQKQGAPSALPDWMPLDSWAGYLEMRKKIKKAPTDRAVVLLIASLGKMRDDGQDIAAVLDKSTKSNWTDVYPIREAQNSRAPPPQDPRFFGLAGLDRTGDQLAMDASMKRHGVVVGDDDDLSFDLPGRQNETNN